MPGLEVLRGLATGQWLTALSHGTRHLRDNTRLLPGVLRKPRLAGLWIATALRAQVALGLGLLVLVFIAPPALTRISADLYPPVYEQQNVLERLFEGRRTMSNPLREARYQQFLAGAWILGLSPALVLLLQHLSLAVTLGKDRARKLRAAAEKLAESDPEQSARLYQSAQALTLDRERVGGVTRLSSHGPVGSDGKTEVISRAERRGKPPSHIGAGQRYRLDKAIGSGGMGVVYAGADTLLKRPVALKQLFNHLVGDTEQIERFRQEALALASLTHSHIVTIYDLIEHDAHFWIVMELLTGGSLADLISSEGQIPIERCIEIAIDIAGGLGCAHQLGIVHRDVKPMNILFTADGNAKLTDFGNAKLNESIVHTREGLMLGSPNFMSPEQVDGSPIDLRTDVYSLGITLFQMLTGKVPFAGDLNSILAQHVNAVPRPPSELNPLVTAELDSVVLRMLNKAPEDRFQDCRELIAALRSTGELQTARR